MVQAIEPGSYARPWDNEDPKVSEGDPPDVVIRLGDKRWPFWYDEMTPRHQRTIRAETGMSAAKWVGLYAAGSELDAWCVLAWLARVQCGEDVTLDEIESSVVEGDDYGAEPGKVGATEDDYPES